MVPISKRSMSDFGGPCMGHGPWRENGMNLEKLTHLGYLPT